MGQGRSPCELPPQLANERSYVVASEVSEWRKKKEKRKMKKQTPFFKPLF